MNSTLLSLAFVLLGVAVTLSAPLDGRRGGRRWRPETKDEQRTYLQRFGHWRGRKQDNNGTDEDFKKSLRAFQRFAGLGPTGEIDDDTKDLMGTPRCGLPDDDEVPGRRRRFVKYGTKWSRKDLTYFLENETPDLSPGVTKSDVAKAFKFWSDYAPLKFSESKSAMADINIRFASGYHGDNAPFDGAGGVLAHAFFPPAGNVHFDDDETWTHASSSGTNFLQVATHEFGHVLGLAHSQVRGSVMYPYYTSYKPNFDLQLDDINGIQSIYGIQVPTGLPPINAPSSSPLPVGSSSSLPVGSSSALPARSTTSKSSAPSTTTTRSPTTRPPTRTTTFFRRPRRRCSFYYYWFGWC